MSKISGKNDRGIWRAIYSSLYDDIGFLQLSSNARFLLTTLRTSPQCNLICIFPLYIDPLVKYTGFSRKEVEKNLNTLCHTLWIRVEDGLCWIINGLRFDPNISLENPKHVEAIRKCLVGLPKSKIVKDFIEYYSLPIAYDIPSPIAYPIAYANQETDTDTETEEETDTEQEQDRTSPAQNLITLFNDTCNNLPKIRELSKSRDSKIEVRLKEHPSLDWWKCVFVEANEVLIPGKNGQRDWSPSFDWLIDNDKNALKVMEGNYSKRASPSPFKPQPGIAAFVERHRREEDEVQ